MDGSLEKRLGDLYWSNADIISESAPVLNAPRADALVAFNLTGVPARGSAGGDRYHYTGLREAFGAEYESYFTPSYASASVRHLDLEGGRAGFMNGFHSGAEPLTETPEGVVYGSLAAAAVRYPDLVGRYYNRLSGEYGDALSALNTVFAQDGAFVYVPRGVRVARPLLVTFAHYSEDEALRCFARSLFVFERDSEAQLVIDDRSEGDGAALDCQVRELFVGSGARVELVELLRLGDRSTLVSSSFAEQWESSRLHTLSVALDGRLVRSNQQVRLLGSGAENHTNALMLCGAGEHIDFNTSLEHAAADCTSYELVKAIAADRGAGVFGGRIYVAQDAQRTQAYQQNNNLLLGDAAHVYSKPQLEIYADNVKCSHGATVGRLSAEALYYMRQRGLSDRDARRLQMFGFANQVIEKIPVEGLTGTIEELAAAKIDRM